MESELLDAGVNVSYARSPSLPTGFCCVCITGSNRAMVASQGAAACPGRLLTHLALPQCVTMLERARCVYLTGYSLRNQPEATLQLARYAAARNRTVAFSPGSCFVIQRVRAMLADLMPLVDILFCNDSEALEWGKALGPRPSSYVPPPLGGVSSWLRKSALPGVFATTPARDAVEAAALALARQPKANGRRGRIVVVTRAGEPVVVAQDGTLMYYPITALHDRPSAPATVQSVGGIRDTTAAGDSFAGGFLACWALNHTNYGDNDATFPERQSEGARGAEARRRSTKDLTRECVRVGLAASQYMVRRLGCGMPAARTNVRCASGLTAISVRWRRRSTVRFL